MTAESLEAVRNVLPTRLQKNKIESAKERSSTELRFASFRSRL